jgi:hypothetical protein
VDLKSLAHKSNWPSETILRGRLKELSFLMIVTPVIIVHTGDIPDFESAIQVDIWVVATVPHVVATRSAVSR